MKVALVWGRMNPPTIGHLKLLTLLDQYGNKGYEPILGVTKSRLMPQDYRRAYRETEKAESLEDKLQVTAEILRDPLSFDLKKSFIERIIAEHNFSIQFLDNLNNEDIKTLGDALLFLAEEDKKDIVLIAGSDEVPEFEGFIQRYNNSQSDGFQVNAKVVSAGKRRNGDDVNGMSATKLRMTALNNDFEAFKSGVATDDEELAWDIFNAVKNGLEIPEEHRTTKRITKKKDIQENVLSSYLTDSLYSRT
jgi:nicotinic acid mononucleotide adenylyltransferase